MSITKEAVKPISFNNDVFFRHSFAGKDAKSKRLREEVVEAILHRRFEELMVVSPDITPDSLEGKNIHLDILLKDRSSGEVVNMEMQVSKYNLNFAKRFQYYSSRLVTDQPIVGAKYSKLVTTYQIVFIDDMPKQVEQLIQRYTLKDEEGREMFGNLTNQIYVFLPMINEIVKEKEIKELSEFEKLCYLFKNNRDDGIIKAIKETEGVAKILMEKYDEFAKEKELYTLARALEDGRLNMEARIADGVEEGLEKGLEQGLQQGLEKGLKQGLEQGEVLALQKAINKRYHQEAKQWLETLSKQQIEHAMDVLFDCDDFEEFKTGVEKIV